LTTLLGTCAGLGSHDNNLDRGEKDQGGSVYYVAWTSLLPARSTPCNSAVTQCTERAKGQRRVMGAGKSRQVPFSYEEACRRIDPPVLARIEETFRRSFATTGYLPQSTFSRDILGDIVPSKLAEVCIMGAVNSRCCSYYKDGRGT
jgi:hypothetical protein